MTNPACVPRLKGQDNSAEGAEAGWSDRVSKGHKGQYISVNTPINKRIRHQIGAADSVITKPRLSVAGGRISRGDKGQNLPFYAAAYKRYRPQPGLNDIAIKKPEYNFPHGCSENRFPIEYRLIHQGGFPLCEKPPVWISSPEKSLEGSISPVRKSLKSFSDSELIVRMEKINLRERKAMLEMLWHLVELDARRLYLSRGYSSLFDFCVRHLRYSESSALRRIRAARCIKNYPEIFDMLCRGEINLSTVSLVSEVITSGNRKEILSGIKNRSTRSAKILLSKYNPRTIIRDKVTPVYIMKKVSDSGNHGSNSGKEKTISQGDEPSSGMTDGKNFTSDVGGQKSSTLNSVKSGGQTGTSEPEKIGVDKPLPRVIMEQKFRLEFAVAPAFMDKVKRVRELLSTKYPEGLQYERVFEILMDEYIERRSSESRRERRKIGKKQRTAAQKPEQTVQRRRMPASRKSESIQGTKSAQNSQSIQGAKQVRKSKSVQKAKSIRQAKSILNSDFRPEKSKYKRSRYIPASVRDEVFARDGNRCTYVSPQGKRCNSSWNLEIDHIIPYARGGGNNLENLRLLCPRHNRMEAERVYGREFMGRYNRRE